MNLEVERRKSFSFTYFNRPISNTQSVWYTNAERLYKQPSVVSGEYSEISAIEVTPQDDPVFVTPPESECASLDYVQMECDVHPDTEEAFDEDTLVPPKLIASKCDSLAPPENQLVMSNLLSIFPRRFCRLYYLPAVIDVECKISGEIYYIYFLYIEKFGLMLVVMLLYITSYRSVIVSTPPYCSTALRYWEICDIYSQIYARN